MAQSVCLKHIDREGDNAAGNTIQTALTSSSWLGFAIVPELY